MNPWDDPKIRIVGRLQNLLEAVRSGSTDLTGLPHLFLVGLDKLPPREAETWLANAIGDKGRVLTGRDMEPPPGPDGPAPERSGSPGVGPEEKSLLWGK